MEWITNGDVLESGSYVIELSRPGHWVLTRNDHLQGVHVRPESEWSARSLSQLKAIAEAIDSRDDARRRGQLHVALLIGSVIVFGGAAGGSGSASAVVAIASAGAVLYALSRVIDLWRRRPWDDIRRGYQ